MAHGLPDASNVVNQRRVFQLEDDAELAVRLGSPHSIDRLGDVLWQDTFAHTLAGWDIYSWSDVDWAIRSPMMALTDGYSMHLHTEGDPGESVSVEHDWNWLYNGYLGAEFWIGDGYYTDEFSVSWWSGNVDGSGLFELRIDNGAGELQYRDAAHAWHMITDELAGFGGWRFTPLKILLNPEAQEWVGVCWNGIWYDMRGIAPQWPGPLFPWTQQFTISTVNINGWENHTFIDNVIFTQNEVTPTFDEVV